MTASDTLISVAWDPTIDPADSDPRRIIEADFIAEGHLLIDSLLSLPAEAVAALPPRVIRHLTVLEELEREYAICEPGVREDDSPPPGQRQAA